MRGWGKLLRPSEGYQGSDWAGRGEQLLTCMWEAGCIPGADKSLARPWNETSYSDQDLQHYTKTYGVKTAGIRPCCLYAISLGKVL